MKQRQMKRNKINNGDLAKKSQQQRQDSEYSDLQGKRMRQCVNVAFLVAVTALAAGLIYLSLFVPPADIARPMM